MTSTGQARRPAGRDGVALRLWLRAGVGQGGHGSVEEDTTGRARRSAGELRSLQTSPLRSAAVHVFFSFVRFSVSLQPLLASRRVGTGAAVVLDISYFS